MMTSHKVNEIPETDGGFYLHSSFCVSEKCNMPDCFIYIVYTGYVDVCTLQDKDVPKKISIVVKQHFFEAHTHFATATVKTA